MMSLSGKRVLFLAANQASTDARAMKEARVLAASGATVQFIGLAADGFPDREVVEGVTIVRVPNGKWRRASDRDLISEYLPTDLHAVLHPWISELERAPPRQAMVDILKRVSKRVLRKIPKLNEAAYKTAKILTDNTFYTRHPVFLANVLRAGVDIEPDIIHAHDIYPLSAALALGFKLNVPVVYDAHEMETERVPPLPAAKKSFIHDLEGVAARRGAALVTVSEGICAHYAKVFRDVNLVMNIPDIRLGYTGEDIRTMCGVQGAPLVVYTGGVGGEFRGLDKVVEALSALPDYHLAVLGPRNERYDTWLAGAASKHGVSDRVHMLPPVHASDVPSVISSADIAVCPIQDATLSYRHSMPNKLFEAAWAELPICVSDLPDMREFVTELGIGVVMDQTDPQSISDALRYAYTNKSAFRMTDETKAALESKYSWAAQSNRLLCLYERILSG